MPDLHEYAHTPGPWRVNIPESEEIAENWAGISAEGWIDLASVAICRRNPVTGVQFNPTGIKNAFLIAAAPDMFEILARISRDHLGDLPDSLSDEIVLVLANARGMTEGELDKESNRT